jgi:hypothetical protein
MKYVHYYFLGLHPVKQQSKIVTCGLQKDASPLVIHELTGTKYSFILGQDALKVKKQIVTMCKVRKKLKNILLFSLILIFGFQFFSIYPIKICV